ncbi:hypothetical protein IFM89_011730 [Coptis chinensis]|uniref:FCP1 homology domain-containing protein n=1 Tax=Coptis chinensis TaxID=261450 RepID=A0A835IUW9_9MAGN|nr:hypothetical protein IFM89_011730 [Coptis chinensis]
MEGAVVGPSKSRKRKAPQVSLNDSMGSTTTTILKTKNKLPVSSMGKDRRLSASVKRNANVILALEAVPQTANGHEVRKAPQKRMSKRRTGQGNNNPVEPEKIKLHSSSEKNHSNQNLMENKLDQFDRNVSTASLNSTTSSKVNHKVDIATLCKVQNGNVPVDKCLEGALQTADKHEEVWVVRRKRTSKGRRRADQENKNMDLNLEESKCNLFDGKNTATLPNTETVSKVKLQNQEVTGDKSSEDAFQTAVKHEEESSQKRKRTRIGKRRTVEGNKSLRENGVNKLCSALEKDQSGQSLTEDNLDLSDRNIPTASPNTRTASKVSHKVNHTTSSRIQNRNLTVNKSIEVASQPAEKHEEVSPVQRKRNSKRKRRGDQENTNMNLNLEEGECKLFEGKACTTFPNTELVSGVNHKVGGNGLDKVQNQVVTVDKSLEDASQTTVQRKSKRKKCADQSNTNMEQNPKEGKCKSSDGNTCTSSPSTEIVAEFNHKVGGNGLDKVQNQEVTVNRSLEDVSQTAVRKRKSKGKKRANQDNTNMEQNPKEGKCISSDGKTCTSSRSTETVAEFIHKVSGNGLDKVQNQEVTVDKSLENASQTTVRKRKSKGKKRADQDNTNMEQNPKEAKCKSSYGKSYTTLPIAETVAEFTTKVGGNGLDKVQIQEVTADRSSEALLQAEEHIEMFGVQQKKKRKRTSKSCTDQGNENPLESGRNKLSSCLEKNHLVEDLVEDKLDHKVDGNELDKVQNQEAIFNKSSEASLQTAENIEECTVQQKKKRRKTSKRRNDQGNNSPLESGMNKLPSILEKNHSDQDLMEKKLDASDRNNPSASLTTGTASHVNHKVGDATSCKVHNIVVPVNKCVEAASQSADKHEEVCVSRKKRKIARKRCADQENKNLLESGCIGVSIITNTKQLELENSVPERAPHIRRKLLILDLNGLLVDIVSSLPHGYQADKRVAKKALLKRPFCDDFLKFCFQRFRVGVWSSRTRRNVDTVVDYIMADFRHELLFCWDQSHCTTTGFYTLADRHKPLVLKELRKLWDKHVPSLPWEKGEYNESNTLLLDDSPYKALLNPPHTAIFPVSYKFQNSNDNSLAPGGDLRIYLEGLAIAENVQKYIEQHPFGQGSITNKNQSWSYYLKIINKFRLPT